MSDLIRWSRPKWRNTIFILFFVHGILIWLFSDASMPKPLPIKTRPIVHWMNKATSSSPDVYYFNELLNPTLFALPHTNNFSGDAWIKLPPLVYQTPEWSDFSSGVGLNAGILGQAFAKETLARSPLISLTSEPTKPRFLELLLPLPQPTKESSYSISGPLANCSNTLPAKLPFWPHQDSLNLSNTIIQIWANGQGNVVTLALESSCGFSDADRYAMAESKLARFQRNLSKPSGLGEESLDLVSSRIIFQWITTNVQSTNNL